MTACLRRRLVRMRTEAALPEIINIGEVGPLYTCSKYHHSINISSVIYNSQQILVQMILLRNNLAEWQLSSCSEGAQKQSGVVLDLTRAGIHEFHPAPSHSQNVGVDLGLPMLVQVAPLGNKGYDPL
jgi:hypothetical protein